MVDNKSAIALMKNPVAERSKHEQIPYFIRESLKRVIQVKFVTLGVGEKSLISILGKWDENQLKSFRLGSPRLFGEDDRSFEKLVQYQINQLKIEFLRFKTAVVLWTMHPWERDARLINDALLDGPKSYNVIIGARRAYHSLFERSIEEDVASYVTTDERKVNPLLDDDVVTTLATRSKLHIKALFKSYKEISGGFLDEELETNLSLKDTVQCLCTPPAYFCKVIEAALVQEADENTREGLTRVIVTRADNDMMYIKEAYHQMYSDTLSKRIESATNGNYKDFLLTLIAREEKR
ncbi:annexin D4 [Tanacetum coccineum]